MKKLLLTALSLSLLLLLIACAGNAAKTTAPSAAVAGLQASISQAG